jgi:hypothetical protein
MTLGAQAFAALAIGCAPSSEVASSELRPTVTDALVLPPRFALSRRHR